MWFFRPVLPFGDLLFIHALTNATDDHKYSPLPSADFDIAEVLVPFSALILVPKNVPFDFERLRAPSQSQKGHFYEKTKLKK